MINENVLFLFAKSGCKNGQCPSWFPMRNGKVLIQGYVMNDDKARAEYKVPRPSIALRFPVATYDAGRILADKRLAEMASEDLPFGCSTERTPETLPWPMWSDTEVLVWGEEVADPAVLAGINANPTERFIALTVDEFLKIGGRLERSA